MPHPRFYNATDKLVAAFLTGDIKHGNQCSCAVGNLLDGYMKWYGEGLAYVPLFSFESTEKFGQVGYNVDEIFEIEKCFEGRETSRLKDWTGQTICEVNDPDGFIGLCNVFDYLISAEDWKDEESKVNLVEMCLQ